MLSLARKLSWIQLIARPENNLGYNAWMLFDDIGSVNLALIRLNRRRSARQTAINGTMVLAPNTPIPYGDK